MKPIIPLFLLLLIGIQLSAQIAPDKYWVQFTDKNQSPYQIDQPEQFLSKRAIDRRVRFNIPITEQDFPVNPSYLDSLRATGVQVLYSSRWFNGAAIHTTDTAGLPPIVQLPFVAKMEPIRQYTGSRPELPPDQKHVKTLLNGEPTQDTSYYNYGASAHQIGMLKGHILHNQGLTGKGMVIAVLDGGFTDVPINPAFDSLWENNQILGHWDFVEGQPLTFDKHVHGSNVLSIMAANMPGTFVGTAPGASYYLFRTENGGSEYTIEEYHWLAGAEFADSAGVDLINSSLGYIRFDDPSMDYTYDDMDGNTTLITRAADVAASKGILVVTSASNQGNTDWKYIGAPADGDSVFSVGAVDENGQYAAFSSIGPTADGRIKPNVSAMGQMTAFVSSQGSVMNGNGTSYSSPIICGLTACLWQSNRSVNNMELMEFIQQSASQADHPDNQLGYGLPDYSQAYFSLLGIESIDVGSQGLVRIYPNPFSSSLTVEYFVSNPKEFDIIILEMSGKKVYQKTITPGYNNLSRIKIAGQSHLPNGIYFLQIISEKHTEVSRIIKQSN